MSDIVDRARLALQEVGVCVSDLEGEIGRLQAALHKIAEDSEAEDRVHIARRALEQKP